MDMPIPPVASANPAINPLRLDTLAIHQRTHLRRAHQRRGNLMVHNHLSLGSPTDEAAVLPETYALQSSVMQLSDDFRSRVKEEYQIDTRWKAVLHSSSKQRPQTQTQ
ncbi:hypothetical protein PENNAL_c0029G06945 [Penicillium nalgiovense]|uniref:Uncharacterized protein n=1 Tax=Penicillium nalgiovense TaxID=60175 RepID=A0A1V6Y9Y4_PENNA|nr:hypothetical protein PENNAL_c0029G06945 [Penicillium nalgiovense]